MIISLVKKIKDLIDRLSYWITEREKVRKLKEAGEPKPWTNDEILQNYRFCNVRRMDDTVSKWLYENWYKPNINHKNIVLAASVGRFFNLPEVLELVGFPDVWEPKKVKKLLWERAYNGDPVFNSAYIICGKKGEAKIDTVIDGLLPLSKGAVWPDTSSMEKTWEMFGGIRGFGSFMAGQVVADLRWAMSGRWEDKNTWAPIGPGSRRGLSYLLSGDPYKLDFTQEEFVRNLNMVMKRAKNSLPVEITSRLEAMDYQNCLCELFKYVRTLDGTGSPPKRRYNGRA